MPDRRFALFPKVPALPCFLALLLPAFTVARAQAPLPIYTDQMVNGFQDWSWGSRNLGNSSPVHSGSNSICASLVTWQALSFWHQEFNAVVYANFSFWANGGTNGGQRLQVYAQYGTNSGTTYQLSSSLPAHSWQLFVVPFSVLGVANVTNLHRINLQLTGSGTTGTFYVDDVQLTAAPAPALSHLSLNTTQAVRMVDARWFGINTAMWDGYFDTPETIALLQQMGTRALRCMGGSASDEYHWATDKSLTNTWAWQTSFANLLHVATNIGAQVFTTVNYGTGTTNEAAAWVAYANGFATNTLSLGVDKFGTNWRTVGYWASLRAAAPLGQDDGKNFLRISRAAPLGFQYWEIGNECHGTWETDSNTVPHDPFTYATRARDYLHQMKAVDPTVKVGVVVTPGEGSYSNNANHFAVNPRTGSTNYGWTPILLTNLARLGVTPDFAIHHSYATGDSDPLLLQAAGGVNGWASDAASLRQMLNDYLGNAGTNVELCVTENNTSSRGKQLTSLVNGLFYADSLSQLMKTEFNSFLWWDLRNGIWTDGDLDATIYGWRIYGDEGVIGGLADRYPAFYAAKLMQYFAQPGDTVVSAASDYVLLSAYAVRRASGAVTLLVLNKDTTTNFNAQINLNGYLSGPTATVLSYGIPQDEAARTNAPAAAQDIATNAFTGAGASFSCSFPALSLTLFTFAPAAPSLVILPPAPQPGGQFVFQLQGQPGVRYYIQNSANLSAWTTVSTNRLTGNTLNLTNPVSAGAAISFWRTVWQP
jgi:alpha-L-arabinofuranosidase